MKLSKREKALLIILLVFGTLALFIAYVILPGMRTVQEKESRITELELAFMEKQDAITLFSGEQARLDQENANSLSLYGELYSNKTYDTGLLLSNMMAKHNLTPINLSIMEDKPSTLVDPQLIEGVEDEFFMGEETGEATEAEEAEEAEENAVDLAESMGMYAREREVSMVFQGSRADANAFFDELSTFDIRYVLHGMSVVYSADSVQYMAQLTLYEFAPIQGEE